MPARRIAIIGGGAAGFFAALAAAAVDPAARITIYEAGREPLRKVRISGGGRCNVTNACTDPATLIERYPRGGRQLRGPFTRFGPAQMRSWLAERGIELKEEDHGRLFPTSDDAGTIVRCFRQAADRAGIHLRCRLAIGAIDGLIDDFRLQHQDGSDPADRILLATGSSRSGWALAEACGIRLVDPVPSLFTFRIDDPDLQALAGISVDEATVALDCSQRRRGHPGAVLITHWGLSGPAVLACSAWSARELHACAYRSRCQVAWSTLDRDGWKHWLDDRRRQGRRSVGNDPLPGLSKRLWQYLCQRAGLDAAVTWSQLGGAAAERLYQTLTACSWDLAGTATFKEEFVTAGGIALDQVDFRSMALRQHPGIHAAGEVLDIDAVTGGYNFQAAWTTGWIAGGAMAS